MKNKIDDDTFRKISMVLGREISLFDIGQVNSFLDFSKLNVNDFKKLKKITECLQFLLLDLN